MFRKLLLIAVFVSSLLYSSLVAQADWLPSIISTNRGDSYSWTNSRTFKLTGIVVTFASPTANTNIIDWINMGGSTSNRLDTSSDVSAQQTVIYEPDGDGFHISAGDVIKIDPTDTNVWYTTIMRDDGNSN